MAFHSYAAQYLAAARAAPPREGFSPVPYYLYSLSLELALKAFLLAKGRTRKELKEKLGHNLAALLATAEQERLADHVPVSPDIRHQVALANDYYQTRALEYFDLGKALRGFKGLPDVVSVDTFLSSLLTSTHTLCYSA